MNKPSIVYAYKLTDFEVWQRDILVDYDIQSGITLCNGHYEARYDIYKLSKFLWFKTRAFAPQVRLETLEEVNAWLLIETGEHFSKDKQ